MQLKGDVMSSDSKELSDIANKLRIDVLRAVSTARSGHPTSCSSIAEIVAVLFFKIMRFSVHHPADAANDRLILSKGHAAPILYSAWAELGLFPKEKLSNVRTLYSDLEGHPTPRLEFIDVATGSSGYGLSAAAGMAYVGKKIDMANYRVYCIVGDGECAEGTIWEAVNFASFYKLDNLCVIVDVNRLGQMGPTALGHDTETYRKRFESFDCNVTVIDGHSVDELWSAFTSAAKFKDKPSVIVAKTIKGKNYPPADDAEGWHGRVVELDTSKCIKQLESLISNRDAIALKPQSVAKKWPKEEKRQVRLSTSPDYTSPDKVATNLACANGLVKIAQSHNKVIIFDADVGLDTYSVKVKDYDASRFVQCFSSEQNAVGVAIGAACKKRTIPFVSTFGAFLTKAFDVIRMGAISKTDINICGSHCGIAEGEDGPSHMALEDLAMFRAIPGCVIFCPSDAVSTERAVEMAANTNRITYIRTSSYPVPVIYNNDKLFRIGEGQILRNHDQDKALIVCAGVTVSEVLAAERQLSAEGIHIRVMDLFTVKPIDKEGIVKNAKAVKGKIITVEDHYAEGGVGEAVLAAVSEHQDITVKVIAVPKIPRSGKPSELLDYFGISALNIVMTVKEMFGSKY